MRLDEKPLILRPFLYVSRAIYRIFFEKPLWWFLAKMKIFFLADMAAQVERIERRLEKEESGHQQRLAAIQEQLRGLEAGNAVQWDALEQLLLALFRQRELQSLNPNEEASMLEHTAVSMTDGLNRVHEPNNIR